jgi:SAM-dependent methyltransferase
VELPLTDIVKNASLVLPPVRRYYVRRRSHIECGTPCDREYPLALFEKHRAAIEKVRPISGRVLEIGPGGNVAVAALFVKHGADDAVCIDSENWLVDAESVYMDLGLDDAALRRVRYEADCPLESASLADASFTIAFSHACLEHVADPAAGIRNLARMLEPGGITTHEIDLRDHRDFARPLRFLKHRDIVWRLATSRRPGAPNRWRVSDYEEAFANVGLEITDLERTSTVEVTETDRGSLAPRFRRRSLDDLATTTVFLTAVKR